MKNKGKRESSNTFKAEIWSYKGEAVNEVDKSFCCNDWLEVNFQSLHIQRFGCLQDKTGQKNLEAYQKALVTQTKNLPHN